MTIPAYFTRTANINNPLFKKRNFIEKTGTILARHTARGAWCLAPEEQRKGEE
jgi:hypothetical protein